MYKVISKFWDKQDLTEHTYQENDPFPFDNREIKESRIQELSTDLNGLGYPLIILESDLIDMKKSEIQNILQAENIEFEKEKSKEELIRQYEEYHSRIKLLDEALELGIEVPEEISNIQIVKLILGKE